MRKKIGGHQENEVPHDDQDSGARYPNWGTAHGADHLSRWLTYCPAPVFPVRRLEDANAFGFNRYMIAPVAVTVAFDLTKKYDHHPLLKEPDVQKVVIDLHDYPPGIIFEHELLVA